MAACNMADDVDNQIGGKKLFHATIDDESTRTFVDENIRLRWNAEDLISLFEGTTRNKKYKFLGETGDNAGDFEDITIGFGSGNDIDRYYAIYPYSSTTKLHEDGYITYTFPEEQNYTENSFGLGANPMVAVTGGLNDFDLCFRNAAGYLRLYLYGDDITIKSIKIEGNNSEPLAGKAYITPEFGGFPTTEMTETATTSATLNCGEGVTIGTTAETATPFWIALPPTVFSKGFTITATNSNGDAFIKKFSSEITIERNKYLSAKVEVLYKKAPSYAWYTSATDDIYTIKTAEDLYALTKLTNGDTDALAAVGETEAPTFEGKTINLSSDINLAAYCSEVVESWRPIGEFMGTFEGNGYYIYNLYCDDDELKDSNISGSWEMALFNSLSNATIRNLNINGQINCLHHSSTIGGIAASASNSIFENCKANIEINISYGGTGHTAGGICASANYTTFIANQAIVNISTYQPEYYFNSFYGGIVGWCISGKLVACKTQGNIKERNTQAFSYIGGIVGFLPDGDPTTIDACFSSCDVQSRQPGLILGSYGTEQGTPKISNCYYSGKGSGMSSSSLGIGTKYYSGNEKPYDYGTYRLYEIPNAIESMNNTIIEWITNNLDYTCDYRYFASESDTIELISVE